MGVLVAELLICPFCAMSNNLKRWANHSLLDITEYVEGFGWVTEEWKPISNYKPGYEVSTFGRLKTLPKRYNGYTTSILSQNIQFKYCKSVIASKNFFVHRLVGLEFLENKENKPFINHLDGDTENNFYKNLDWCTQKENIHHAIKIGLIDNLGENHPLSKLTNIQAKEIYESVLDRKTIANIYAVSVDTINLIKNGRIWQHITGAEYKRKHKSPLDKDLVLNIFYDNSTLKEIAEKYGVRYDTVWQIKAGKVFSNITGVKYG